MTRYDDAVTAVDADDMNMARGAHIMGPAPSHMCILGVMVFTQLLTSVFDIDQMPPPCDTSGDCSVLGHDVVVDIQYMKYNEPERIPFVARTSENVY
jgi:hypothetical protein